MAHRWGGFTVDQGMHVYRGLPQHGLVYLATPYTRHPEGHGTAYIQAAQLAAKLLNAGVHVLSPIVHGHPIATYGGLDPLAHDIWLPLDKSLMAACNCMLIGKLPGWRESYGIAQEIKFFESWKRRIFELDPDTMTIEQRPRI